MNAIETKLSGCFVLEPKVFKDNRGYFVESYNKSIFKEVTGLDVTFVQDNESLSSRGVLRGLHFQIGAYAQAKLVRVIKGSVLDVVVDLRSNSLTYGQHLSFKLSADNKKQIFIPRGFAHGFLALEDHTVFSYKCDNYYNKESERGVFYNDPELNIDWNIPKNELIVSKKDIDLPLLNDLDL